MFNSISNQLSSYQYSSNYKPNQNQYLVTSNINPNSYPLPIYNHPSKLPIRFSFQSPPIYRSIISPKPLTSPNTQLR